MDKYANKHADQIHHHVNTAIGGYENIRNKVIEGYNDIQKVKQFEEFNMKQIFYRYIYI